MNYGGQIILSSTRLLFRGHLPGDRDAYCAMEMDAEVRRYVGGQPRTREEAERRFMAALKPADDLLSMWATLLKETGQYVGRCGVYPHFDRNGIPIAEEGTLAFYIASGYWRKGFATEAAQALIQFGFNELNLKLLVSTVQDGNEASSHILKKLGFDLVSTEEGYRTFYHFELKNPVT